MNEDNDCRDCRQAKVVENLAARMAVMEGDNLMREHRLTSQEEQTKNLFSILTEIKEDIKTIATSVSNLSIKLTTLESKPAEDAKISRDATKRTVWTVAITAFITVLVSTATTLLLTGLWTKIF